MKYKERYSIETVATPRGKVESKWVKMRFTQTLEKYLIVAEDVEMWLTRYQWRKVVTIDQFLTTLEEKERETARKFIYGYHI